MQKYLEDNQINIGFTIPIRYVKIGQLIACTSTIIVVYRSNICMVADLKWKI